MKIKAAVLREVNKPLTIEELELMGPKANEVMVAVEATGFCHSDLHIMEGDVEAPLPMVMGHESAGVVEKVGTGVTKVQVGDRVACTWMIPCGKCFQCLRGHGNICEGNFAAFLGGNLPDGTSRLRDKDGNRVGHGFFVAGFADHTVVHEDGVFKVPDDLPLAEACYLGCCTSTGYGAVANVGNVKAGTSVAVYGMGGVGLSMVRAAKIRHGNPVVAVDIEESKKEMALEFGATHFICNAKENPVEKIMEITGGAGAECVFEAIGDPGAIVQAYWCVRMGGSLIIAGICPAGHTSNLDLFLLPLHSKKIIGTLYGEIIPSIDIPKFADFAVTGGFMTKELTTKKLKLEDINEAREAMINRSLVGRWLIMMD